MSGSESQPRKVELNISVCAFKTMQLIVCESLHITTKPVITPTETILTTLIVIVSIRLALNA